MRRWTEDHGAPGLRDKFSVYKTRDDHYHGMIMVDKIAKFDYSDRIGADGEFVFVLRPETDRHAVTALYCYADHVALRDGQLAADIYAQLDRICEENTP